MSTFIRSMRWSGLLGVIFVLLGQIADTTAVENGRRVVIVVWDGMRPDLVTEQNTPTLWALGQSGVVFHNHHAVYISATNVNGAAIATGDYPGHTDLVANHEYRPKIDRQKSLDVEVPDVVEKGDAVSGGKYVAVPTLSEIIRQFGGHTVVVSAKTVGFLLDRKAAEAARPSPGENSVNFAAGRAWPNEFLDQFTALLGSFPKSHPEQDKWTTQALTEILWKDGNPPLSILWLGEPDLTEHETAPGAPAALAAIKSSDDNLAAVLTTLGRLKARQNTDVFVVSDHGFSTIEHAIDLRKVLTDAGFKVVTEFNGEPAPDQIMMVGVGGSVLFYLPKNAAPLTRRLIEFLQQSSYAGVIFTKDRIDGTFSLEQAKIDSPDAPDIVMAFRWSDGKNQFGIPGMIDADWQRAAGKGTHATLSRFDMHNTLIAAGPDFRSGLTSDLPSGNVDLAPTIAKILAISAPPMDGRVLSEALVNSPQTPPQSNSQTLEASKTFPSGSWKQTLHTSQVGSTVYLDFGRSEFVPRGR